jgi:glucose-1-phosphate adenylyltransferase
MNQTLAVILAGGRGTRLSPLTTSTAKPVLPFAGGFRIVDFVFSNCINSRIPSLLFITRDRDDAVESYVHRLRERIPPRLSARTLVRAASDRPGGRGGTAEAVAGVLPALREQRPREVLVLASDHVYRMDYAPMLDFHRSVGAGMTVGTVEVPTAEASRYGVLARDAAGRITEFAEKPQRPASVPGSPGRSRVSMGIYVFDARVLESFLARDEADGSSMHDFGRDVVPALVSARLAWAYAFPGYWRDVGTLDTYYAAHREVLRAPAPALLHDPSWPLASAGWPFLPAQGLVDGRGSLICPGSLSEPGSLVVDSAISPAVRIGRGAVLEKCIVLDGAQVGAGARLRGVIVDSGEQVPAGTVLGQDADEPGTHLVISSGMLFPFSAPSAPFARAPHRGSHELRPRLASWSAPGKCSP